MTAISEPVIRHRINVEWFRDWNAPHPAVGHPDAWRRPFRSEPSRDVPTGARPALRNDYQSVVFATPDAGVDPATEPLLTIIFRAVMAARHRTQPVVTFQDAAEPTPTGESFPGTDYRMVDGGPRLAPNDVSWLARAQTSPWISDDQLGQLRHAYQNLAIEREALHRLERERDELNDRQGLAPSEGDLALSWAQQSRLAALDPAVDEAQADIARAAGAFDRITKVIAADVALARESMVNPGLIPDADVPAPATWDPLTDTEGDAITEYARFYPLAVQYAEQHEALALELDRSRAVNDESPFDPGYNPDLHSRRIWDADADLLDAKRKFDATDWEIAKAGGEVDHSEADPRRAVYTPRGQRITVELTPATIAATESGVPKTPDRRARLQQSQRLARASGPPAQRLAVCGRSDTFQGAPRAKAFPLVGLG
jgi:hypothetical protein